MSLKRRAAYSDKEIINCIRANNEDKVLKYLYEVFLPIVKAYINSNSGDDDEAYDIFQDAIMVFYKYVKQGKFNETYSIEAFIRGVSKNLWINRVKKMNRNIPIDNDNLNSLAVESLQQELINKDKEEKVTEMFAILGEKCKEMLTYSVFHQLTMKEISQKMGFANENVAKTKNYKCKQRLLKLLEEHQEIKNIFLQTT